MAHPIPPPEPAPLVQPSNYKELQPVSKNLFKPLSGIQSVNANVFTAPIQPESLSSKPVPVSAIKSADILGKPLSVSYPVNQLKSTNAPRQLNRAESPQTLCSTDGISIRKCPPQLPPALAESPNPQPVEFDFRVRQSEDQPTKLPVSATRQKQPTAQGRQAPVIRQQQSQPSAPGQSPKTAPVRKRIVQLTSDRQEYDEQRQIVTAEGNVLLRFNGAVLDADRLQVNLSNLIAVGEGNVALTRGKQVLRGQRFTYNFIQDTGEIRKARGEIFIPTASEAFSGNLPTDVSAGGVPANPPSDRITANQPLRRVTSPGGIQVTVGSQRNARNVPLPQPAGQVRRLRFEAEQIDFYPRGWQANSVRITNDPFSPPELELRARKVTLTRETPLRERLKATRPRLVLDQGLSLPVPRDQAVIDRRQRNTSPGLAQIGFDSNDRGGLYVERSFTPIDTPVAQLSLTPQFYAQEAVQDSGGNIFDPDLFGLKARLNADLGPRTTVQGSGVLTSLNLQDVEDTLRASLRLRQTIGSTLPHTLALEYSYRDRLYNGSLGYQTVQSSVGGVLTSPIIPLGNTGINLSYQLGAQYINARTDRLDLLEPIRENDRVSLSRFQGSAALNRNFVLWRGKGLRPTADQGLRYTPAPVVPYLQVITGVTGIGSFYSNGDNQSLLIGTIGLQGQFGHFSRSFLDYTSFNVVYSQGIRSGTSPFLFDRAADTSVLSVGLTQQIYGPFRFGIQTAINLDTSEQISTDYTLEYSRRTYGIVLRYNPKLELGSLSFRINDFNWAGGTQPFSDSEVQPVVGGVVREND